MKTIAKIYYVVTSTDALALYVILLTNYSFYAASKNYPSDDGTGMLGLAALVCNLGLAVKTHLFIKEYLKKYVK